MDFAVDRLVFGPDDVDLSRSPLAGHLDAAIDEVRPRVEAAVREVEPRVDRFIRDVQPRLDSLVARLQKGLDDLRRDLDVRAKRASGPPSGHIAADAGAAGAPTDPPDSDASG